MQPPVTEWWCSSRRITAWVRTREDAIEDTAPILRTFVGQRLDALDAWMARQGGYRRMELPDEMDDMPRIRLREPDLDL